MSDTFGSERDEHDKEEWLKAVSDNDEQQNEED